MKINDILNTPLFGITISILAFSIGLRVSRKLRSPVFNPLIIGGLLVIGFLSIFKIDLQVYNKGGDMIKFFIAPATVALAVPLYKNIDLLKESFLSIIVGITAGAIAGMLTVILLGRIFGIDETIIRSLIPKSTTAAIGLSISEYNGGLIELTAIFIVFTGVFGSMVVDKVYSICRIEDKVAKGIGLGSASHVMGTSKAMELGDTEGAFASVGISIAGILTVFMAPWIIKIFF